MPKYNIPDLRTSGNGKYAYTFDWGRRADGSRHQETRSGFGSKREANDDYQKLLVEKEATKANKMMVTTSFSFGQFVEDNFLPTYRDSVRPQTYHGRAAMIHKHFQSLWKFELSEITPEMVMKWKNQLRHHQSLSNEYVRKICGLGHRIFSLAVDMKLLSTNPAEVLKKTKFLRDEQRTLNFWTLDEFQKVATSFNQTDTNEVWGLTILSFLFLTGLRIGEAQALEWKIWILRANGYMLRKQ
ncbi:site-specific integrase [Sporolactobacillus shoreae]|uniref:Site-specific integrase n=1 Tax=Sporolactobacillus shoreae TaxID=1465501 RepID=A0A4Z0GNG9_9BACL|nr:site-specific integrase [Sporolactobacillus shoreae]TGA97492.1 site-specific integrase [Sporolactobacillus shoreae]